MHPTAMENGKLFFSTYVPPELPARVVEIGSQNVNGSLKEVCSPHADYTGVDCAAGVGVDVVLEDPYKLPFESESLDVVVCSSVFEHSELFWVLFLEILRTLKPSGIFYLNAPSNGLFHRYPVDCWRFYPDSGVALIRWAERNHLRSVLLESFVSRQDVNGWNDFVAVFLKDEACLAQHPRRMLDTKKDFLNGLVPARGGAFLNEYASSEDQMKLHAIRQITLGTLRVG